MKRYDWMLLEIECLLCGRSLGRAAGRTDPRQAGSGTVLPTGARAADRAAMVRRGQLARLRCDTCGGPGMVAAVDEFFTYSEESGPLFRRRASPSPASAS